MGAEITQLVERPTEKPDAMMARLFLVSRFGLAVRPSGYHSLAGKQRDLGLKLLRLSFHFKKLWSVDTVL